MIILLTTLMSLSIVFLWLNHPMSMGLILIIMTLIVSVLTGLMMKSFLFSYILVIIMLSGVLVLFIYMASMASNEKFQMSFKIILVYWSCNYLIILMSDKLKWAESIMLINFNTNNELISLNKVFNTYTVIITIMMMFYLLLTMIVVSNISSSQEGPLRMKN